MGRGGGVMFVVADVQMADLELLTKKFDSPVSF